MTKRERKYIAAQNKRRNQTANSHLELRRLISFRLQFDSYGNEIIL